MKAVIKDPVCGMSMNEAFALRGERGGKTYYFCGDACRQRFLSEPVSKKKEDKPGSGK